MHFFATEDADTVVALAQVPVPMPRPMRLGAAWCGAGIVEVWLATKRVGVLSQ